MKPIIETPISLVPTLLFVKSHSQSNYHNSIINTQTRTSIQNYLLITLTIIQFPCNSLMRLIYRKKKRREGITRVSTRVDGEEVEEHYAKHA